MPTKKKAVRKRTASPRKPILTFQGMLAELRRFFNEAGLNEQAQLWDVLSAVRGPDNESYEAKNATTAIIRAVAFGKHPIVSCGLTWAEEDGSRALSTRKKMYEDVPHNHHFFYHARNAFERLGLAWDKVNDKSKFI